MHRGHEVFHTTTHIGTVTPNLTPPTAKGKPTRPPPARAFMAHHGPSLGLGSKKTYHATRAQAAQAIATSHARATRTKQPKQPGQTKASTTVKKPAIASYGARLTAPKEIFEYGARSYAQGRDERG